MRCIFAFLLTIAVTPAFADEPAERPPERKVLDRWVGTWNVEVEIKPGPNIQIPESRFQETKTAAWILKGTYLEESIQSDHHEGKALTGYDPSAEHYRVWHFSTQGNPSQFIGTWNQKTQTMTWEQETKHPDNPTIEGVTRFISEDEYLVEFTAKDASGKLLGQITATHKRVKE